jgi:hypothetical protein
MSSAMRLQLYRPTVADYWTELARGFLFLFEIRRQQAKNSPIQTIQRFWRGVMDQRKQHQPVARAIARLVAESNAYVRHHLESSSSSSLSDGDADVGGDGSGTPPPTSPASDGGAGGQRHDGTVRKGSWLFGGDDELSVTASDLSEDSPHAGVVAIAMPHGEALPTSMSDTPGALGADYHPLPHEQQLQQQQQADPVFRVDRHQLLSSLQRTLEHHGGRSEAHVRTHCCVCCFDWRCLACCFE